MDRRAFLETSAAGLGLAALSPGVFAAAPSTPVRVGLIGCGWYGKADLLRRPYRQPWVLPEPDNV